MSSYAVESKYDQAEQPDDITTRADKQRPIRHRGWKVLGILILGSVLWMQKNWKNKDGLLKNDVESRDDEFDWYAVSRSP